MSIYFFVTGEPKPQPRPRAWARRFAETMRAGVYDNGGADGWKAAIVAQANTKRPAAPISGPISITLNFHMPRPKSHFRTGKRAADLRENAPFDHCQKPDCDNLAKAVLDALTVAGWWTDDAQVVHLSVRKHWAGSEVGCYVAIETEPAA